LSDYTGETTLKTPPADLLAAAKAVLPNAYAPYSHYSVAAAIRAENGMILTGCNVENAAFPVGMCAEAAAIGALITQGHRQMTEALVLVKDTQICPPCGACRQRFLESAPLEMIIHLCTLDGQYQQTTLAELLPHAFGPQNLKEKI
jgi:cytidine deaminase